MSLDNVSFIKIDVEGCAPQIFEGSIDTIERCRPVIFTDQLGDIIHKLNYDVTSMSERSGEVMNLCVPKEKPV